MLGPVPGIKRRRYIKIHIIKPDIVVLKIWKQDIVRQKLCSWLITLAKQNLSISDLLFFSVGEELWVNLLKASKFIPKTKHVFHTDSTYYLQNNLQLDHLNKAAANYRTNLFNEFSHWERDYRERRGPKTLG